MKGLLFDMPGFAYTKEFEEFWKKYPGRANKRGRIVKHDKSGALSQWKALSPDDKAAALNGVELISQEGLPPDARRYLLNKLWENEDVTDAVRKKMAQNRTTTQKEKEGTDYAPWIMEQSHASLETFLQRMPHLTWLVKKLRPELGF